MGEIIEFFKKSKEKQKRNKIDADEFYELSSFIREMAEQMSLEELKLFTAILSNKEANSLARKIVAVEILARIIPGKAGKEQNYSSFEKTVEGIIVKMRDYVAQKMFDKEDDSDKKR
ncbi:hypothetical protein [Thermodesulfovibrio yellowstonii]|uniref:hypothetical protein n=1 Tax=Thermodesulfovibrio yellowstonii TaxID=28262 RepID=UPI000407CF5F|nr:hypothetical protein [Thermodesulfovibrio islandicus]